METKDARILNRRRINKSLNKIYSYPLFVLQAPIGYGKTVAIKSFLRSKSSDVIQISLSGTSGSADYVWERLCRRMEKIFPQLGRRLKKVGRPGTAGKTACAVELLSGWTFEKPLLVAIDDFQLMENGDFLQFIELVAKERIGNLHFILLTRETADSTLLEYAQKQLCYIFTEKELKFTREEIEAYFNLMEVPVTSEDMDKICRYTDGWIAMVRLALQSVGQGLPLDKTSALEEFIETNVYGKLNDTQKKVLLKLSLLGEFSAGMAMWALEEKEEQQCLKKLIGGKTFLSLDERSGRYRVGSPLEAFLVNKGQWEAIQRSALFNRAGDWYIRSGRYKSAFEYYYRSGNREAILKILDPDNAPEIPYDQFDQIQRVFENLPKDLCMKYPVAYLKYIRIFALRGEPNQCKSRLIVMREDVKGSGFSEGIKTLLLAEIEVLWTYLYFNDMEKMLEASLKALRLFDGGRSSIVTKSADFSFGSPQLLFSYFREKGKMFHTMQFIANNFDVLQLVFGGCGTGCDSLVKAEYALETGRCEEVELNARKAIYKARDAAQNSIVLCAQFALARLFINADRMSELEAVLKSMRQEAAGGTNPVLSTTRELIEAYLAACLRKPEKIAPWILQGDAANASFLSQGKPYYYIVYGKVLLLGGEYLKLASLCELMLMLYGESGNQLGILYTCVYQSIAQFHLHGAGAAGKALAEALLLGQADNIILPFAENACYIAGFLEEGAKEAGCSRSYTDRLLACCDGYERSVKRVQAGHIDLTEREKEVLRLLERGWKHSDIGKELFVSVTTIRYHVRNIYTKLEVNDKVLAIKKARKLKLI